MKKIISILTIAIVSIAITAFTTKEKFKTKKAPEGSCYFFVAIASGEQNCNGLTVNQAKGYKSRTASGSFNYKTEYNKIQNEVAEYYNIETSRVTVKTSSQPYVCIVRYDHSIPGWGCTVVRYAVGFGSSESTAETNALNIRDSKSGSYSVVESYSCN